jgi:DNA polymerase-1
MRHIIFEESDAHPIALLIKASAFDRNEIEATYIPTLLSNGIPKRDVVVMSLAYNQAGKAPTKYIANYLEDLLPALDSIGTKLIYCADAAYFNALTKGKKASANLGYVNPCKILGYEHMEVILGVNHKSLMYNPANEPKLTMSLQTLVDHVGGQHVEPGKDVIKYAYYPETEEAIYDALQTLHQYDELTCDVETFSLRFDEAGVGTVSFCWNEHEGIAFAVDYQQLTQRNEQGQYGIQVSNAPVKNLLREFFESYKGTFTWHNSPFDTKILIYELWMQNLLDIKGMLDGLHVLHQRIHDTKIIAYLATNTTAGNKLSLKELAHEFAGNYGMGDNINDIRLIPLPMLLEYNLTDGLCTWFVRNKYQPMMVADLQDEIYQDIMMPSQKVITQMELTGMPLNPDKVQYARKKLEGIKAEQEKAFVDHPVIRALEKKLTYQAWDKDFTDRRDKAKNPDKILPKDRANFPNSTFNPNSNQQLQKLLYEEMGLPVIDKTKTKQPATGAKTVVKLLNHTDNQEYIRTLEAVMAWSQAEKVLSTFITAFERAIDKGDGIVYLHGSFNLGGTKSGRLSSSDPNLQNIPAGSTYGKLVKECFEAPDGKLFGGADFNSLEDYISALTTRDPNKIKVYTEGYDGHSLRAFSYWPEKFPCDVMTPEFSHALKKNPLLDAIRAKSKNPTFALTYQGTWITLVNNLGFDKPDALIIEANYHELYQVSDAWVQAKLDQASIDGYVTVAFGLRLRTPLLGQIIRGRGRVPYEAEAEGRTAGNALGQSYGLLTNRAMNDFMQKVWQSRYRYDILPSAAIHDAIYLIIKDDIDVVEWVNRELIKSMQWQELPELQHDTVKLGAALDIFYPNWASPCMLPNYADKKEIRAVCANFLVELNPIKQEAA